MQERYRKQDYYQNRGKSIRTDKPSCADNHSARQNLWASIHKAEVMPLAIAVASIIQSCAVLGVQSQTLDTFWATGCTLTAQLIWPSMYNLANGRVTNTSSDLDCCFHSNCLQSRIELSISSIYAIRASRKGASLGKPRAYSPSSVSYFHHGACSSK